MVLRETAVAVSLLPPTLARPEREQKQRNELAFQTFQDVLQGTIHFKVSCSISHKDLDGNSPIATLVHASPTSPRPKAPPRDSLMTR